MGCISNAAWKMFWNQKAFSVCICLCVHVDTQNTKQGYGVIGEMLSLCLLTFLVPCTNRQLNKTITMVSVPSALLTLWNAECQGIGFPSSIFISKAFSPDAEDPVKL